MKTNYFEIIASMGFDKILKIITCLLLMAILIVQVLILQRMPPTIGDLSKAKTEENVRKLLFKRPLVHIPETLDVEVQNVSLDVEIQNVPLGVVVYR